MTILSDAEIANLSGPAKLHAMLAKRRAEREAMEAAKVATAIQQQHEMKHIPMAAIQPEEPQTPATNADNATVAADKPAIVWNAEQQRAISMAISGQGFCLIGAAGTGKTTTLKEVVRQKVEWATAQGIVSPTVVGLVSFTNRAVRNIIKAVSDIGAAGYCNTIHKFLGYHPEWFDYEDEEGNMRKTMRFIPTYGLHNPIMDCLVVVIDESSMVDTRLHQQLVEACPNATFIYVGDLNQLPPVFGDAILGYKLTELPVVELKQVYRQAMESPIIWFQHEYTLAGKIPSDTDIAKINERWEGKGLQFKPFKRDADPEVMAEAVASSMTREYEAGNYDPDQDTILIPYNKAFGCDLINTHLAEYFAIKECRVVHEVIAGFEKHYYANNDFVIYQKKECKIVDIKRNRQYFGAIPQQESSDLSRYGYIRAGGLATPTVLNLDAPEGHDFLALLDATSADAGSDDEAKTQAASHIIVMQDMETGGIVEARTSGEVNDIKFGWCMTVHRSQGSEWRKVWLVLCRQHRNMLSREILYTGMTRARKELTVIYTPQTAPGRKDNSIARCIKNQSIPGNGWREKAEVFKGKKDRNGGTIA